MRSSPAVVLFTYNRAEKARRVLQSLTAQGVEKIYIFCDGAKDDDIDQRRVKENQALVKRFAIKKKEIVISRKNKGLANSIISGVTQAFENEHELVILEDDCLPFNQMYRFMRETLEYWRGYKDIFSISAYHFIRSDPGISINYDVFCSNRFLPWGWATWKNRWEMVLSELKDRNNPFGGFIDVPDIAGRDLRYHSYAVEKKMVDSWAIPLGLITLAKNFRHIMPVQPLVNNIGMDDSGTNTGSAHNRIQPVKRPPNYGFPLKMCPYDFSDTNLEQTFIDSLDVMLPPQWLMERIQQELKLKNYAE